MQGQGGNGAVNLYKSDESERTLGRIVVAYIVAVCVMAVIGIIVKGGN